MACAGIAVGVRGGGAELSFAKRRKACSPHACRMRMPLEEGWVGGGEVRV